MPRAAVRECQNIFRLFFCMIKKYVWFFKNCSFAETCFAVSQLFSTVRTSMFLFHLTERKANLFYPEINDGMKNESPKVL